MTYWRKIFKKALKSSKGQKLLNREYFANKGSRIFRKNEIESLVVGLCTNMMEALDLVGKKKGGGGLNLKVEKITNKQILKRIKKVIYKKEMLGGQGIMVAIIKPPISGVDDILIQINSANGCYVEVVQDWEAYAIMRAYRKALQYKYGSLKKCNHLM